MFKKFFIALAIVSMFSIGETNAQDAMLAEVKLFAGTFAPRGWAFCEGQLLPINQYQALFSLLGTTYGGDGRTTFALPDLRGRAPIGVGTGPGLEPVRLGQKTTAGSDGYEAHSSLGMHYIIALQGYFPSRN
jgi:microcystin-dependent protein